MRTITEPRGDEPGEIVNAIFRTFPGEAARRAEEARRAEAARLSDEYEAARHAPFRPDGPPPKTRKRRAILAVGTDDCAFELPPPPPRIPSVFEVGDDDHVSELRDDDAPRPLLDVGDER